MPKSPECRNVCIPGILFCSIEILSPVSAAAAPALIRPLSQEKILIPARKNF